jgi:hypothetical protein
MVLRRPFPKKVFKSGLLSLLCGAVTLAKLGVHASSMIFNAHSEDYKYT